MRSLALGVGILLIIALVLAAVPVCSILFSNANDAAAQNEEVARYRRVDIPRELSKRIPGARSSVWNKKVEHFSGSGR